MDDESVVKVDDIQLSELDKVVESDIPANDSSDNGNNLDQRENPETPTPLSTKKGSEVLTDVSNDEAGVTECQDHAFGFSTSGVKVGSPKGTSTFESSASNASFENSSLPSEDVFKDKSLETNDQAHCEVEVVGLTSAPVFEPGHSSSGSRTPTSSEGPATEKNASGNDVSGTDTQSSPTPPAANLTEDVADREQTGTDFQADIVLEALGASGTDQFGKETVDGEALATSRLPSSESLHKSNSLTLQLSLEKHNEADMSLDLLHTSEKKSVLKPELDVDNLESFGNGDEKAALNASSTSVMVNPTSQTEETRGHAFASAQSLGTFSTGAFQPQGKQPNRSGTGRQQSVALSDCPQGEKEVMNFLNRINCQDLFQKFCEFGFRDMKTVEKISLLDLQEMELRGGFKYKLIDVLGLDSSTSAKAKQEHPICEEMQRTGEPIQQSPHSEKRTPDQLSSKDQLASSPGSLKETTPATDKPNDSEVKCGDQNELQFQLSSSFLLETSEENDFLGDDDKNGDAASKRNSPTEIFEEARQGIDDDSSEVFFMAQEPVDVQPERETSVDNVLVTFHALVDPSEWGGYSARSDATRHIFIELSIANKPPNRVKMAFERSFRLHEGHMALLIGQYYLPESLVDKSIPYEYKFTNERNDVFREFIFSKRKGERPRVLHVPLNSKDYAKYDHVIRKDQNTFSWIKSFVLSDTRALDGRALAIKAMIPNWTGFSPTGSVKMLARDALYQFYDVVTQLESVCTVGDSRKSKRKGVTIEKVLADIVKPKIDHLKKESSTSFDATADKAVSSLAIAVLIFHYKIQDQLDVGDFEALAVSLNLYPDVKNASCASYDVICQNFEDKREVILAISLIFDVLLKRASSKSNFTNWLIAMPLIHLLTESILPYGFVRFSDWTKMEWYFIPKDVWKYAELFAKEIKKTDRICFDDDFKMLIIPLLALDRVFIRTILFVCPLKYLVFWVDDSQPYEILVVLVNKTKHVLGRGSGTRDMEPITHIREILLALRKRLSSSHKNFTPEESSLFLKDGLEALTHLCLTLWQRKDVCEGLFETLLDLVIEYFRLLSGLQLFRDGEELRHRIEHISHVASDWIISVTWKKLFEEQKESFVADVKLRAAVILKANILCPDLYDLWTDCLISDFNVHLRQRQDLDNLIKLDAVLSVGEDIPLHHKLSCFLKSFLEEALEALTCEKGGFADSSIIRLFESSEKNWTLARAMLRQIVDKEAPKLSSPSEQWLRSFFSHWSLWISCLRLSEARLSEDKKLCQTIVIARKVLVECADKVIFGEVTVSDIRLVAKEKRKFFDLCESISKDFLGKNETKTVSRAVEDRLQELEALELKRREISDLVIQCQNMNLNSEFIDGLKRLCGDDLQDSQISKVVSRSGATLKVVHFRLSDETEDLVTSLYNLKKSRLFLRLFRSHLKGVAANRGDSVPELPSLSSEQETMGLLVTPVIECWKGVSERLRNGSITAASVRQYFIDGDVFNNELKLKNELRIFCQVPLHGTQDELWLDARCQQILFYRKLCGAIEAARAVKRLCEVLEVPLLSSVSKICELDSSKHAQRPLAEDFIGGALSSAQQFLAQMKSNEITCLHTFSECRSLSQWVRQEIGEWKELETFVELAATTAEGDFETTKLASLRAACGGFSPFLFGPQSETELKFDNFEDFLSACRRVFSRLEQDKLFPQKWKDSEKYLENFKVIKKSLGSVEKSSFSQVESINFRGQYVIGCQSYKEVPLDDAECLRLKLRASLSANERILYLSDLQDLQSKLILISGHSSERQSELTYFSSVLKKVLRLTSLFVELCKSGHVKYLTREEKVFDCVSPNTNGESDSEEKVLVRFRDLKQSLDEEEKAMEKDLEESRERMTVLRSKYYYLNYFTTVQLLKLSERLGKLAKSAPNEDLDISIYSLLACIKPSVQEGNIKSAMKEVLAPRRMRDTNRSISFSGYDEDSFSEVDLASLPGMENYDLSETTMTSHSSEFKEAPLSLKEDDSPVFNVDNEDYLSLNCLGKVLLRLSKTYGKRPRRSFPTDHFTIGEPNLVVVSEAELYWTVVRLYMNSELPLSHEVLLCSAGTTDEDVVIFWRRALKDPFHHIFCLAAVDRLSYEVCRNAVDQLFELNREAASRGEQRYQLVIVSCCENYLVSAFDRYRRHPLPCPSYEHVKGYLLQQFQLGPEKAKNLKSPARTHTKWTPAAEELDEEKSCVRVIYSLRSGVGKSLAVAGMEQRLSLLRNNKEALSIKSLASVDKHPITKIILPLHEPSVDVDGIFEILETAYPHPGLALSRLIHLDISPSVIHGIEDFLFNLLFLGCLTDSKGRVWHRRPVDMCVLELTWPDVQDNLLKKSSIDRPKRVLFQYVLPATLCRTPLEVLESGERSRLVCSQLTNSHFQRAFQYLSRFSKREDLTLFTFDPNLIEGNVLHCLKTLIESIPDQSDPSWAVVDHFVKFLSYQLKVCEENDFCRPEAYGDDLPGFKNFVMKLAIKMSRDFSTPSIKSVINPGDLLQYERRRRWEETLHPYIFFNKDRHSVTFVGFQVTRAGWLINPETKDEGERVMSRNLSTALYTQGFRLQEDGEHLKKAKKIELLCQVMGIENVNDPDPTYELTLDNVIKMLAIEMRFRCGIPVVIMGETGCGKTRLIKYLCSLGDTSRQTEKNGVAEAKAIASEGVHEKIEEVECVDGEDEDYDIEESAASEEASSDFMEIHSESLFKIEEMPLVSSPFKPQSSEREASEDVNDEDRIEAMEDVFHSESTGEIEALDEIDEMPLVNQSFSPRSSERLSSELQGQNSSSNTSASDLASFSGEHRSPKTKDMLLVRVHGGITRKEIVRSVEKAEERAKKNDELGIETVLFFDEANTTEAVGLIKEIMCDKRVNGRKIYGLGSTLHVIAACNPYRKHTEEMIKKLDSAGLGYHVGTGSTHDRLGNIPLRHLVYRVHSLPESLKALLWDFGKLKPAAERKYILLIVQRFASNFKASCSDLNSLIDVIADVITASQNYMRSCNDECSFVSLRDVERTMTVMVWFYRLHAVLENSMQKQYEEDDRRFHTAFNSLTRSLVLALGVNYYVRLRSREDYLRQISKLFRNPCQVIESWRQLQNEIDYCQSVFLNELKLPPNIGRNHALKENVFMMVVCIDLRIPLFLVGKPGSSKSLAKDVLKTAMTGEMSTSPLFKLFKQLHMVSYQCSPLSTAEGIIGSFDQCQKMQKESDCNRFVACVVLDEVGLAEDSPRLPLKALHPLLDDGSVGADFDEDHVPDFGNSNRVAFVGISNWALDPAKMNRGIFVQRGTPTSEELVVSARGICETDDVVLSLDRLIPGMAKAYLEICAADCKKDFFGLRDFYSLVKMVVSLCKRIGREPTRGQMVHAVSRNFGGLEGVDCVDIFLRHIGGILEEDNPTDEIENSPSSLIQENLRGGGIFECESRYLLLLTENYAALTIFQEHILGPEDDAVILFGSSFPKDQEYTQVCRNINRVKVCMATGKTVVLLNLDKTYESLYDALNQYYVNHGGLRFVDLGLGSHRVKCLVHLNFRLILIADRDAVYNKFPTPLINRMEKHCLSISSILCKREEIVLKALEKWAEAFAGVRKPFVYSQSQNSQSLFTPSDVFIGYHPEAPATIILRVCRLLETQKRTSDSSLWEGRVLKEAKQVLLQSAAPDAVIRLPVSRLKAEAFDLWSGYFEQQCHSSLADYLRSKFAHIDEDSLTQVTTHSRFLSRESVSEVAQAIEMLTDFISLQQFDTEKQFRSCIRRFYKSSGQVNFRVLLVFVESEDVQGELAACARYLVQEEKRNAFKNVKIRLSKHVVFIVHLSRVVRECFRGFHGGAWTQVHIDDLMPAKHLRKLSVTAVQGKRMSTLLGAERTEREADFEHGYRLMPDPVISSWHLFRSCVHAATSRLDDPFNAPADSASKRLGLLLQLLPDKEGSPGVVPGFFEGLERTVIDLIIAREQESPNCGQDWVNFEALCQSSLQAGGTFRNSLWLKVLTVATPLFAEVIAFLSVDSNLSLLKEAVDGTTNWRTKFWTDVFLLCPQLATYDGFLTSRERQFQQRVVVKGSGFQGHIFNAQFPFSSLVKDQINEYAVTARLVADERGTLTIDHLHELVEKSKLGKVIDYAEKAAEDNELAERYLHDYVHMVYKPRGKRDFNLVSSAIIAGFKEIAADPNVGVDPLTGEKDIVFEKLTVSAVHVAHDFIKSRLSNFVALVQLDDGFLDSLSDDQFQGHSEMTLDLIALTEFLKRLQSSLSHVSGKRHKLEWLQKVRKGKPHVEACLALLEKETSLSRRASLRRTARFLWTKILAVWLFYEHTSFTDFGESKFLRIAGEKLASIFDDEPDFKSFKTMTLIVKFINETCNELSEKTIGSSGKECAICHEPWRDPVKLPCRHVYCLSCIRQWMDPERIAKLNLHSANCPLCESELSSDFQLAVSSQLSKHCSRFIALCHCLMSFFMEIVAVYTFSENSSEHPEPDLVCLLMDFVTQRPQGSSCRALNSSPHLRLNAVEPTPSVKTFFLQLVLKHSNDKAKAYVKKYFERIREDVLEHSYGHVFQKDSIDFGVIYIQCVEDSIFRAILALNSESRKSALVEKQLSFAKENLKEDHNSLQYLNAVAATRSCLVFVAEEITNFLDQPGQDAISPGLEDIFSLIESLLKKSEDSQLLFFLLKQLTWRRGADFWTQISGISGLEWLDDLVSEFSTQNSEEALPDNFLVFGKEYFVLRRATAQSILQEKRFPIENALKESTLFRSSKTVYLLLALHRQLTVRRCSDDDFRTEVYDMLLEYFMSASDVPEWAQTLGAQLIRNELAGRCAPEVFRAAPGQDARTMTATAVMFHVWLALQSNQSDSLIRPLFTLMNDPSQFKDAFLPTMPDDDALMVIQAVRGDIGTKWRECCEGHKYFIDDCGNADESSQCFCGAIIGKIEGYLDDAKERQTRTDKGHILGEPRDREQFSAPERELSSALCSLMRILLHGALMWASCQEATVDAVVSLTHATVSHESLPFFFWSHFLKDLEGFSDAIGLAVDNASLVAHQVLDRIVNHPACGEMVSSRDFASKEGRASWEKEFCNHFFQPVMQVVCTNLPRWIETVARDDDLEQNSMYRWIHEVEAPRLFKSPSAWWRHRVPVSVKHLEMLFVRKYGREDTSKVPRILKEFLEHEQKLRPLIHLISIISLQRLLMEKFHRRLDIGKANKLTIAEFLKQLPDREREKYSSLIGIFGKVWSVIGKRALHWHGRFKTKLPDDTLPSMFSRNTPIAFLLPTAKGRGVCARLLVEYLVSVQNEFIARFRELSSSSEQHAEISMDFLSQAHLISYDYDRDLLSLVLAHCSYSLEAGSGAKIEYDFPSLERELINRYFSGKPSIKFKPLQFAYSQDFYSMAFFDRIRRKVSQEKLPGAVSRQIVSELHDITDVYAVLSVLDIVIGFLVSTGGDGDDTLHNYLHITLRMPDDQGLISPKAVRFCCLKHVLSFWTILTVERNKRLVLAEKNPFEDFPVTFKDSLAKDLETEFVRQLTHINLDIFMGELMHLAWLEIKNKVEVKDFENYSLGNALSDFCNSKLKGLEKLPEEIKLRHLSACWTQTVLFQANRDHPQYH
ncbi:E3 ubiquitin-protein ligase rnf213-alpha-like isoform X3 [Oscarella lobularis]|uniref:E3 ubiquitin-protein ligase rnf213-alpha-like isoform X3 n=1 Tax=Oscarella lobularis TaxID=121494 RepID=UPI003313A1A9